MKCKSKMTEKAIEKKMQKMVCGRGGLTRKFVSPNAPGVPDRIVITPAGVVWFVELKTISGRLTPLQKHEIAEFEKRNANVRVLYGWDAAREFIEGVMGK